MEMDFKFWNGKKVEDVGQYLREFLTENPTYRIYVGCDSADKEDSKITYVVAVCLYSEMLQKGAHILYLQENTRMDTFDSKEKKGAILKRLRGEVQRAYEVGEFLESEMREFCVVRWPEVVDGKKLSIIHLDLNEVAGRKVRKKYRENTSNELINEALGWIKGLGYSVFLKPNAFAASRSADRLC